MKDEPEKRVEYKNEMGVFRHNKQTNKIIMQDLLCSVGYKSRTTYPGFSSEKGN